MINDWKDRILNSILKKYGLRGTLPIVILIIAIPIFTMMLSNGFSSNSNIHEMGFNSSNTTERAQIIDATVINGSNNTVNNPTILIPSPSYQDQQNKVWDEASVPIQEFFRMLSNEDFINARAKLDKTLTKNPVFFENELQGFMNNVSGQVRIIDLGRDESIKKDGNISNRGFNFIARYLTNGKEIRDKWHAVSIKHEQENIWKIGELRCVTTQCDNSLLAQRNFQF